MTTATTDLRARLVEAARDGGEVLVEHSLPDGSLGCCVGVVVAVCARHVVVERGKRPAALPLASIRSVAAAPRRPCCAVCAAREQGAEGGTR
jgi:hypothetical protein